MLWAMPPAPAALKVAPRTIGNPQRCSLWYERQDAIAIADTAVVDGKVYPFCAAECKKTFLADVNKYKINFAMVLGSSKLA